MTDILPLRDFIAIATHCIERHGDDEAAILAELAPALRNLVRQDHWLPEAFAQPDPAFYRQYLLYGDPLDRLSVVSFVWGPSQITPVHDHRVWGLVGVLRGAEIGTVYQRHPDGTLTRGATSRLEAGGVVAVSPKLGDIHTIANAYNDRPSISIHVYGGNIGRIRRTSFNPDTGATQEFVSGYSNAQTPNLWAETT
ncbi:MAG: cysteine dioxygenase [Acetobacteraceae bacterium]|nr:cysteine dioxygenase [Acetobacteraceae bacterium]